jgi:hypothetical protein
MEENFDFQRFRFVLKLKLLNIPPATRIKFKKERAGDKFKIGRNAVSKRNYERNRIESSLDKYQQTCFGIVKEYLRDKTSELLVSPIRDIRYIRKWEKKSAPTIDNVGLMFDDERRPDMYIKLIPYRLFIKNHNKDYILDLTAESYSILLDYFDEEIEKRRKAMERDMERNTLNSLNKILEDAKNY